MLVVTGTVTAHPSTFARVRELSLDHVHRSRKEAGCISHAVHVDCEEPMRLFFFERWADRDALNVHFRQSETAKFIAALRELATHATGPDIFDVTETPLKT
jgi:quinol monooxygenase YgiN